VTERRRVSSGSPYEPILGFSRAVAVGSHVFVAGTAPIMPDGADPPGDPYGQARRCLEIVTSVLQEAGVGPEHVVRTRLYLTRRDDFDEVARAHAELFADIRPVNTTIVVSGFIDPRWLVEVEAEALVPESHP
jgi:enamine deaminase RidA (YjgF/YER057c/UK114 family)